MAENESPKPEQSNSAQPAGDASVLSVDPLEGLSSGLLDAILDHLRANPHFLLEIAWVRRAIAQDRFQAAARAGALVGFSADPSDVAKHTISYNAHTLHSAVTLHRTLMLAHGVTSLAHLALRIPELKVLSVGPRSEAEILDLMGLGFRPQNIEAIDLISYSPWVTLADMHAIPFPDDSFDVVMHGWVLVYSVNPRKAAQELVRVCRNRAVIAISADWSGPRSSSKSDDPLDIHAEAYFQNCDQILDCFPKESIGPIYVRQEAEDYPGVHPRRPREQGSSILVFEIRK